MKKSRIVKIVIILAIWALLLPAFSFAQSAENVEQNVQSESIIVNCFFSPTCPHCSQMEDALEKISQEDTNLEIHRFSITNKDDRETLKDFYEQYDFPDQYKGGVPVVFIKDKYFVGFSANIESSLRKYIQNQENGVHEEMGGVTPINLAENIKIPFLGNVDVSKYSPLALSIILGILDGFNACAMVALLFLLSTLIVIGDRKKVFWIGGTFIFVSGLVYFFFIAVWMNLFLILEQVRVITYLVGAIVVTFSLFLLKDYFSGVVCKLCQVQPGSKNIFVRIEEFFFKKMQFLTNAQLSFPLMLLGVAGVAAGINMVELVCSFGFPLAFTKYLSGLSLSPFSYYSYLLIYILFYTLDDFIIFLIAVFTLKAVKASDKYLQAIKLISAIILLVLGLLMIFAPQILFFG
ncbi:hypothetical protein D4R87_02820 [bacterium]|nr:MAG: hypothetical protein D4R87_02820 [bacterium]